MLAWRDVINQRVKPLSHLQFVALQSTPILVVGLGSLFCHLLLQVGTPTEEDVVDKGVLQQGQKDKHKAAHEENVNGLDVGDLGKSLSKVGIDSGHCQNRGYTCRQANRKGREGWKKVFQQESMLREHLNYRSRRKLS